MRVKRAARKVPYVFYPHADRCGVGITLVILLCMKTAISIRDEIFEAAERTAQALGMSRSELYATAVREFVERYARDGVTERLNKVYADEPAASKLDEGLQALQFASLDRGDAW